MELNYYIIQWIKLKQRKIFYYILLKYKREIECSEIIKSTNFFIYKWLFYICTYVCIFNFIYT